VVIPAPIRRQLGLVESTELLARIQGEGIVLERSGAAIQRLQELVRSSVPEHVSLVDELLAERRAEVVGPGRS
jgi:bifunctional DNA-binding transcriptional regulator/antitoxin component of YhaV-PrlF toxin-antitoxin module